MSLRAKLSFPLTVESMDNILISLKELAALFGMQTPAARRITQSPHFPSVIVLPGGTLRWYRQEVLDFLEEYEHGAKPAKKPEPKAVAAE